MIAAYRQRDRALGHRMMNTLIDALSRAVPAQLPELITLREVRLPKRRLGQARPRRSGREPASQPRARG